MPVSNLYPRGPALLLGGRVIQLANSLAVSVILVRRFGMSVVGVFAVGFIAMSVLSLVSSLGLNAYLPRLSLSRGQLATTALAAQLTAMPLWIAAVLCYASIQAADRSEFQVIALVALIGVPVGLGNVGMMLSIMERRFSPGLLAPLIESGGVLAGGLIATNPLQYAFCLLAARFVAACVIWGGLRFEYTSPATIRSIVSTSVPYMAPDALAMLAEQIAPLLLAGLPPRAALGLFRICQQILTAADTPGWSYVQAHYPELVRESNDGIGDVARRVSLLGTTATIPCVAGSIVLAYFFFHAPAIAPMMAVLSAGLMWRYRNNLYDQALRATGRIAASITLASAKLVSGALLSYALVHEFGIWGAVVATLILSIASGVAYKWVYERRSPVPVLAA